LPEPAQFGEQIKAVLTAAQWDVQFHYTKEMSISVYPPPSEPVLPENGLQCYSSVDDVGMSAFQTALKAKTGIDCPMATTVPMWFRSAARNKAKEFTGGIFVGRRFVYTKEE
jgi:hypothetical protein